MCAASVGDRLKTYRFSFHGKENNNSPQATKTDRRILFSECLCRRSKEVRTVDVIMKKRNGGTLTGAEIKSVINDYVAGRIPDYQVSALLMAVYFRGMTFEETADLTRAMLASGRIIDLSGLAGPFIDKHSTGGVGDKISLILAPMVAACGVKVPMLCGRGLGHTGGTVDKLEAIAGYRTGLEESEIRSVLEKTGFVFMGQTDAIAPADKLLYALRDVTATVESIPLITASILSKKAAEGSDGFVFDVKAGTGAFMKTGAEAEALARSLVKTARVLGKRARAVVTVMDEPLGRMIGNLNEIKETVSCLAGEMPPDIEELTLKLGAHMLVLAGVTDSLEAGASACRAALHNGSALRLFLANIAAQGGDPATIADPARIVLAPCRKAVIADRDGYVASVDAYKIGRAAVLLGAGRAAKDSLLALRSGIELLKKRGEKVIRGGEISVIYSEEGTETAEAIDLIRSAYAWTDDRPAERQLILKEMVDE
jgi:pyrimidine-nucleoside phosphorylase